MQMQKSFDCYGNESQQHQSYASHHEDSWNSRNNHLNMNMKHNNGAFAPHVMPGGGPGYGAHYSPSAHQGYGGGHYPPSMGSGYQGHGHGYGHGHGHFSESSEYESHKEVQNGGGRMKMEEMRYEQRKYGGANADASFYGRRPNNMMNSFHKVEWGVKGV